MVKSSFHKTYLKKVKLGRVGLVDNTPYTYYLHNFLTKNILNPKNVQMTHDMWHVTCEHSLKCQPLSFYVFGLKAFWWFGWKTEVISEWLNEWLREGCQKILNLWACSYLGGWGAHTSLVFNCSGVAWTFLHTPLSLIDFGSGKPKNRFCVHSQHNFSYCFLYISYPQASGISP